MALIQQLLNGMPLWFGIGFLAPLIAQCLVALGWSAPLGLTPLSLGLALGGVLGAVATLRGRWL